jgi:PAS domain S-box-containing protein
MAIVRDVTERRRAEEVTARLAAIVESSDDAIYAEDLDGTITSWNAGAERLYGYSAAEILGRSISMLVPDDHAHETAEMLAHIRRGETVKHHDTVRRRRDGTTVAVSITISPLHDHAGAVVGASLIAHDITLKKAAERRIIAALKEKEVLLKEVHHRVKNNLQVMTSLLSLQREYADGATVESVIDEARSRIASIAVLHEKLYLSEDLARVDLGEYLRDLAQGLLYQYGARSSVRLEVESAEIRVGVDKAIPCGLIAGELVTNALKYAFHGRPGGTIRIELERHNGTVHLAVADDGIGLPPALHHCGAATLGLQLVTTLLEQLNGAMALDRSAGTRFDLTFDV